MFQRKTHILRQNCNGSVFRWMANRIIAVTATATAEAHNTDTLTAV